MWLAGQGGYGIKTSPAMAWAAASIVLGQAVAGGAGGARRLAAEALAPDRFR